MNNTQNRKIAQVKDEVMVVGIDVGSESHYARAFDNRGYEFSAKNTSSSKNASSSTKARIRSDRRKAATFAHVRV